MRYKTLYLKILGFLDLILNKPNIKLLISLKFSIRIFNLCIV
jgi:hypothetical protein